MGRLELLALGTCGDHATCVYTGCGAAAFVLLADGMPLCLIGAGVGVSRACRHFTGTIPPVIIVLDCDNGQTGELAAIISQEGSKGRRIVVGGPDGALAVVRQSLDLALLAECDDVRDSVEFRAIGGPTQPLCIGFGLYIAVPDGVEPQGSRHAAPVTLFAGDPSLAAVAASPLVSLTGPCRPAHWPPLLLAPFVVAWAIPSHDGRLPDVDADQRELRWSTVDALVTVAQRWNRGRIGSGEEVRFAVTGVPSVAVAPSCDHMVTLATGSCVPLLVTDDALSPFDGLGLGSVRTTQQVPTDGYEPDDAPDMTADDDIYDGFSTLGARDRSVVLGVVSRHRSFAASLLKDRRPRPEQRTVAAAGVQTDPMDLSELSAAALDRNDGHQQPVVSPGDHGRKLDESRAHAPGPSTPARRPSSEGPGRRLSPGMPPPPARQGSSTPARHLADDNDGLGRGRSRYRRPTTPTHPARSRGSGVAAAGSAATIRRIYVFSNEEKGWPGRMLLVHKYPTLEALTQAASDACALRPAHRLLFPDGRRVQDLSELDPDAKVILTKKGGRRFDPNDLPRLIRGRH